MPTVEDLAIALTGTVERHRIGSALGQPAIEIPLVRAVLPITDRVRVKDFRKGTAARIADNNGDPTFAELWVAARARAAGWNAVWISRFGGRLIHEWHHRAEQPIAGDLPLTIRESLNKIAALRHEKGSWRNNWDGVPDVIAWRDSEVVMIECKREKRDKLRPNQVAWIHAALLSGWPLWNLAIFEWTFKPVV